VSTVALVICRPKITQITTNCAEQAGRVWRLPRTMALHDMQELDDDLRAGSDQDLALAGLLGVVDGVERIVEDGSADHVGGVV
jgi:hypothetical protein